MAKERTQHLTWLEDASGSGSKINGVNTMMHCLRYFWTNACSRLSIVLIVRGSVSSLPSYAYIARVKHARSVCEAAEYSPTQFERSDAVARDGLAGSHSARRR